MRNSSIPRDADGFRAASGLASWSPDMLSEVILDQSPAPRGPGLFAITRGSGERMITNVRRIAGTERGPGSVLVSSATVLLGLLAAGLFVVSLSAQYRYVLNVKHVAPVSYIEAIGLDAGMVVFSLLALGLARAGQSARVERALIIACALGSAAMNYAASDVTSPRSVAAYVMPPVFLALVVDRTVAVVRRHVLGDAERSAWAVLATVALYALRCVLAPPSTAGGVRRWVLAATPLPAAATEAPGVLVIEPPEDEVTEPAELADASKKARFAWWYERDAAYGDRGQASAAASRIAPVVGLSAGTARAYCYSILAELEKAGAAS
ncbi:MAG: hypothetical protein M3Z75_06570 [Actinomycetota bacterium]|nr:hypothetical protein [Actinomycetota bacterium]